ncbi:MAG: ZIP family metal transporter [Candidatus Doudnabacteria bacterium]|nr:ZIP family metal transporter [Candidatus Doudnabacteria bacterium]
MLPIILAISTFVSTFLGGLFVIKHKDRLHLIMGFAAGVLLGVISFDILPEIIELIHEHGLSVTPVMVALVVGFLLFHIMEKSIAIHHGHEGEYAEHKHPHIGMASALALAAHSFMDGIGIGLGFQVSNAVGIMVAIAVISHDFSDGMNTVTFMLNHKNTTAKAKWFLALDALAPVLGAISTLFFSVSAQVLVIYLGFFAGFLLYIGASDILPEAHSQHSSKWTIALTVFGAAFIFAITRII